MSFWQTVKKSFKDFYEHLFLLAGVSLIWFLIVIALMYVGIGGIVTRQVMPIFLNLIFVGPLTIAAFYITNGLLKFQEFNLKDYFRGFAKFFFKGILAYWLTLSLTIILIVDLIFFLTSGNKILVYLSGIWIYLIIFFTMSQFYFWSLLVELEEGIFKTLKRALLLALDNLVYSLGIFVTFLLLTAVGLLTAGIGLAVTFIGFLGILSNNATYQLLIKYNLREDQISPYHLK